jgi:hypothetical protein
VEVRRWRDQFNLETPIEATDDPQERSKRLDARRNAFNRGVEQLKAAGLVGISGELSWKW